MVLQPQVSLLPSSGNDVLSQCKTVGRGISKNLLRQLKQVTSFKFWSSSPIRLEKVERKVTVEGTCLTGEWRESMVCIHVSVCFSHKLNSVPFCPQ